MLNKELINYQDKLYWIYKKIKVSQFKEDFVNDFKEFWDCEIVLKHRNNNDEFLLFMREIPEVELILD